MKKTHSYATRVVWTGNLGAGTTAYDGYSRDHLIRIGPKEAIEASSDPAFRGDASRHNPEELFVASLSSCHMLWYLHLCAVANVVVTEYADDAQGAMLEEASGAGHFTEVILHPRVTIGPGSDAELALKLHDEAHRHCFLANSVNFPVRCKATIEAAGM